VTPCSFVERYQLLLIKYPDNLKEIFYNNWYLYGKKAFLSKTTMIPFHSCTAVRLYILTANPDNKIVSL